MQKPEIPINESDRLVALDRYKILDTLPEQVYDDLTQLAADICGTPIALISLVDKDRQWFKSRVGLNVSETPRDISFCGHVVAANAILNVPDAILDPRFADNPLVAKEPNIRFYVGVPLITYDNFALGTLCVIDRQPRDLTEQQIKQLEALSRLVISQFELRFKEESLRILASVVESSDDAIMTKTLEGIITSWNPAAEKLFGYSEAEVIGQPIFMLIPPDRLDEEPLILARLRRGERVEHFETIRTSKEGKRIEVSATTSPLVNDAGQVVGASTILRDISDRKQAELDLKESEQNYVSLMAASPVGIFRTDAMGNCTYINDRWCRISGLTLESAIGDGWRQSIHPEDRQSVAAEWYQSVQENRPFSLEYRFQRPDGVVTWVYGQSVVTYNADGIVAGYIGTITDINDRKQAELQLQSATERLALALKSGEIGCWEWDIQQDFLVWDDRMYELYGYSQETYSHLPYEIWSDTIHPDDRDVTKTLLQQAVLGRAKYDCEFRIIHSDGSIHFIKAYGRVKRDSQGKAETMIGVNFDISDRKAIQEALKRSEERALATLLALPDLVFRVNRDGQYMDFLTSPLGKNLVNPDQSLGKSMYEALPVDITPNHVEAKYTALQQALATQTVQAYEQEVRIEGALRYEEVRVAPCGNDEVVFFVRDISDRKLAEEALRASDQRWKFALESAGDGIWDWDVKNDEVFYSPQWKSLLGYADDEIENRLDVWENLVHPDDLAQCYENINKCLNNEVLLYESEHRLRCKDGSYKWILSRGKVLEWDANGRALRVMGTHTDLSDRKQAEQVILQQANRETLLRGITQRIRQSLDLSIIFDTACQEIQQLLQCDRVGIFKFYPESNFNDGEFVAESVVDGFSSAMEVHIHDHCFGENYATAYVQGRMQVVNDIDNAGLTDCHRDILTQFQVRANLVIPLLCGNNLWGLLCIHQCAHTRQWQEYEINLIQELANQLAIAIQQASLYVQLQDELLIRQQSQLKIAQQLREQQTLATITSKIRESLSIKEILAVVTQQVKDVLSSDRVIVFQLFDNGNSQIIEESVHSNFPNLKALNWENEVWSQEILDCYWQGKPRIVPDVMNDIWTECLVEYSIEGQIKSKIIAPILLEAHNSENHRWVATDGSKKLWGVLVVHACAEPREWQDSEAQLLQQIANQLAIAIQQANLFEQSQQEIAERKQAQQQLTESNQQLARATRLKDEFLANMSHELRTPLNSILGMNEALQDEVFGSINERQLKSLRTIENSSTHLLALINDILDVAKIESGQVTLELTATDIDSLCKSSLAFVKQQALTRRIQLIPRIPKYLPEIMIDERRIRQVLINLLNNAVKFTLEGGTITLEVSQVQLESSPTNLTPLNYIKIAVIDTGIGISAENIQKLFQPFIQIDSALNRKHDGTGLGLALVKRLVEIHGGNVELTSEVGVGSCFAINLPIHIGEPAIEEQPEQDLSGQSQIGQSQTEELISPLILLAEDNEANIATFSSYLEAKGYRILLATDGQQAIDLAKVKHPDLILMDIQMPVIDGMEAIKQIRLDRNLVNIPIIALTALAMVGDREKCLTAGANEYLAKPVKLRQLNGVIQQLLSS